MQAACYHGAGDVRIEQVADPVPGPHDVVLRPAFNGLCGTDLHQYLHGPMSDAPLPIVVGHEFSGEVIEVGVDVGDVTVGDLVAVEPIWPCRSCDPCRAGRYNLCGDAIWTGLTGRGGGIAELAVVDASMAHRIPDGVSLLEGALVEPLAVAYHAVQKSRVVPGEVAVVFGAGPIGIGAVLALRASGVDDVIVVEPAAARRTAIEAVGGAEVLDPEVVDVSAALLELSGARGVSVVIDAAGVPSSFDAALSALKAAGRLVIVAAFMEPVSFHPLSVFEREIEILHSFAYCNDFEPVLRLLADGRYATADWVDVVGAGRLLEAYDRLKHRSAIKVLVDVPSMVG
jgi:(R,R)-butanediol dehydrogenase/meso-butanediol dehydrogenase/diacetyl reductase